MHVRDSHGYSHDLDKLTTDLLHPDGPACCIGCLYRLGMSPAFHPGPGYLRIRTSSPALFDACMKISTKLVQQDLRPLQRRLRANIVACTQDSHGEPPVSGVANTMIVNTLISTLYRIVRHTLIGGETSILIRAVQGKAFAASKGPEAGAWPTSPEQIFANGAQETISALVWWTSLVAEPAEMLRFLNILLTTCRSHVFPQLTTPTIHRRFVWTIVQSLNSLIEPSHETSALPSPPFRVPDGWTLQHVGTGDDNDTAGCAIMLLDGMIKGPGSPRNSTPIDIIARGYEQQLLDTFQAALPALRNGKGEFRIKTLESHNMFYQTLAAWSFELAQTLQVPTSKLDAHVQLFLKRASSSGSSAAQILQYFLTQRCNDNRACAACGKSAKQAGAATAKLQTCSRCKMVRYCSKECQKTDWGSGGHKTRCAVFCKAPEVFSPFGVLRATSAEFEEEFDKVLKKDAVTNEDIATVCRWAIDTSSLPRDYTSRLQALVSSVTRISFTNTDFS